MNIYDLLFGVMAFVIASCLIGFVAHLIHAGFRQVYVDRPQLRIIPWSVQSKLRKAKIDVETERAKADLYEAKHASLQRELVYNELEDSRYNKALGKAPTDS